MLSLTKFNGPLLELQVNIRIYIYIYLQIISNFIYMTD
jgi:hypothetical protein